MAVSCMAVALIDMQWSKVEWCIVVIQAQHVQNHSDRIACCEKLKKKKS